MPDFARQPYWIAALVALLGIVVLWQGLELPLTNRNAGIGPGAFVAFTGAMLTLLGAILAFQIARGERFEPQEEENVDAHLAMKPRAFALALAAVALPVVMIKPCGVALTAMVSFTLVARALGSKMLLTDVIIGAILGSAAWFLFDRLGLQLGGYLPFLGI